jgi:hypothetical protein
MNNNILKTLLFSFLISAPNLVFSCDPMSINNVVLEQDYFLITIDRDSLSHCFGSSFIQTNERPQLHFAINGIHYDVNPLKEMREIKSSSQIKIKIPSGFFRFKNRELLLVVARLNQQDIVFKKYLTKEKPHAKGSLEHDRLISYLK